MEPPDPIPNSEVKRSCADDSVGPPHVKVGHLQGLIRNSPLNERAFSCYKDLINILVDIIWY